MRIELKKLLVLALLLLPLKISTAYAHPVFEHQLEALSKKIANAPTNVDYYLLRGDVYLEQSRWSLAKADFERAAYLEPDSGRSDFHFGKLLHFQGELEGAIESLDVALSKNADLVAASLLKAKVLADSKEFKAAADQIGKVISSCKRPLPDLYIQRDRYLADSGAENHKRVALLRDGVKQLGPLVVLLSKIVDLEKEAGNFDQALRDIDLLPSKLRTNPIWLVKKARLLQQTGRSADARAVAKEAKMRISALPKARQNSLNIQNLVSELKLVEK